MKHLCIIFLHHRDDELTRFHAQLLRKFNSSAEFIALTFSEGFPTALRYPLKLPSSHAEWGNADRLVYDWFQSEQRVTAERYVIVEYDTLCLMPLDEFYGAAWSQPVSAAEVKTRDNDPQWHWFQGLPYPSVYPLLGLVPMSCVLLSYLAMQAVSKLSRNPFFNPLCSECRLGTLALLSGFYPSRIRPDASDFISWLPRKPTKAGLWHTVKSKIVSEKAFRSIGAGRFS